MKYNLLNEIHLFHSGTIYLSEYAVRVKQLRARINKVSNIEMQHLNQMADDNELNVHEYEKMKEIIEFKRKKYQEMVNCI